MPDAKELIDRFQRMESDRQPYEAVWRKALENAWSDPPRDFASHASAMGAKGIPGNYHNAARRQHEAARTRYDSTLTFGRERLTAGMHSLITPQSEFWHGLTTAEMDDEETDEEKRYAEQLRNFLFTQRYATRSGFPRAIQAIYDSTVSCGPGFLAVEPGYLRGQHLLYRYLPLQECYIDKDAYGRVDGFARYHFPTAREAVQMYGTAVSEKIRDQAADVKKQGERSPFLEITIPNTDMKPRALHTSDTFEYQKYDIEVDAKRHVRQQGFRSFPVVSFFWSEMLGDLYGTSPCIQYLIEQQTVNAMSKDVLLSLQAMVRPPFGVHDTSLMSRLNLNPGAVNTGAVSAEGRQLAVPLNTGQRPDLVEPFIEQRRKAVQDGLYVTLFQTLVDNPNQTATEALLRDKEKSALLAPVGSRIQSSLAELIDRELEILADRGIYEEGSRFVPPESLEGKEIKPEFTSPFDRLRKAQEGEGFLRTVEMLAPLAQADPTVLNIFDRSKTARGLAEVNGVPLEYLKPEDQLKEEEQQNNEAIAGQQALEGLQGLAGAAKDVVPAIAEANETGVSDALIDAAT